jgi:hypothetical protein
MGQRWRWIPPFETTDAVKIAMDGLRRRASSTAPRRRGGSAHRFLPDHDIVPRIVRAKVSATSFNTEHFEIIVTIQPQTKEILDAFYSNIKVAPSDIESIRIQEYQSWLTMYMTNLSMIGIKSHFHHSINLSKYEVLFLPSDQALTEFGRYYVALRSVLP